MNLHIFNIRRQWHVISIGIVANDKMRAFEIVRALHGHVTELDYDGFFQLKDNTYLESMGFCHEFDREDYEG